MRSIVLRGSSVLTILIFFWLLTGCASRHSPAPSAKSKITQNWDYYNNLVIRIQQEWYGILGNGKFVPTKTGKVVVNFKLHSDGTVSDIKVMKNDESDLLANICVRAVQESAPFPKLSPEMVNKIGDHSDVNFTFDYYDK